MEGFVTVPGIYWAGLMETSHTVEHREWIDSACAGASSTGSMSCE